MKKLLLTFYFAFYIFNAAFSQNPLVKQWDYRFGGTNEDVLHCFLQTVDGGYILGGYSYSGIGGDKSENTCMLSPDYWIIKLDSIGNKLWDKDYGGTDFGGSDDDILNSIQQTADGGYILGGSSRSHANCDKTQDTWGNYDYWIVKLDSLGNKQWDKDFGGTSEDNLYSIKQTFDGGYILGGFSFSDISGSKTQANFDTIFPFTADYWIIKTDSLGVKQWDKVFGGNSGDVFFSLKQTFDGGYILGGYSFSDSSGNKTQANWDSIGTTSDYWIVKIDSVGNKQWDKDFGGTSADNLYSIELTRDNGYILAGMSASGISGDKTQPNWDTCTSCNWADYWIIKIDSIGDKQWDKDFGGTSYEEGATGISETIDGGFLISGISQSNISGDKTENNLGQDQIWVVKTDSLGNKQWDKTVHTTNYDSPYLIHAIQSKDSCYVMAISTAAGIGGDKTQPSWGGDDYWIIKFCDSTITTGISNFQPPTSGFNIFPNPATDFITVSFPLAAEKNVSIEIFDLFGREVLRTPIPIAIGTKLPTKIDMRSFSGGIYFVEIKTGERIYREKVLKK